MNNPEKILKTLDANLSAPVSLILYGRAALALGFKVAPTSFGATMDVDAILPMVDMRDIEKNDDFWDALEKTNEQLAASGLYMTHLFTDDQVILSPEWLEHKVEIESGFQYLNLYRPSTEDLILTKMMRVDPQDRMDIEFLMKRSDLNIILLQQKLKNVVIPNLPELHEAFDENLKWLQSKF